MLPTRITGNSDSNIPLPTFICNSLLELQLFNLQNHLQFAYFTNIHKLLILLMENLCFQHLYIFSRMSTFLTLHLKEKYTLDIELFCQLIFLQVCNFQSCSKPLSHGLYKMTISKKHRASLNSSYEVIAFPFKQTPLGCLFALIC